MRRSGRQPHHARLLPDHARETPVRRHHRRAKQRRVSAQPGRVGGILVRLYVTAGALDAAAAVAAELQDAPLVEAARTLIDIESRMGHLRRQQQIRGSGGRCEV
jgi:hypothetical protein